MSDDVAIPAMLTLAREGKGWTQTRLAERSGVSQAVISKTENGLIDLAGPRLESVADALDCPVNLLTRPSPIEGVQVTCMHRRRGSRMTRGTQRRIEALANLTVMTVANLLRGIELIPETGLETMDIDVYEDPVEIADRLRPAWRLSTGPIDNVVSLVEALGVIIVTRPLDTTAQDAVSIWPRESTAPPIILLNTGLPQDRQRFTLCHELGHMIMHRLPNDDMESQADRFASELLAPAADILPDLAGLTTRDVPRLLELKRKWGMSLAALVRRAKDLDAISDRQYREFNIRFSQLGWKRIEPVELPVESPRTLKRVNSFHQKEEDYTIAELAEVARMNERPFRSLYGWTLDEPTPRTRLRLVRD